MIISVEDRFEKLYMDLKAAGHEVYKLSENKTSEVVIYSGYNTHIAAINASSLTSGNTGVFLINGDNKDAYQIDSMLRNKTYSSLF
ncbi:hypothetical protein OXPF_37120 [Oxobacter pfennigii]|uniref:YkuS family protein n=1 Tax=Oxobacter pfennigii TaxID=36849 RepID=A0A0P8W5L2_9CLOT|nr:YkuS family protein [Oxobacter pfennigii]KPU42943.1 hypothetical protein OXPF_37120 [Oxobacter pfennigii]